MRSWGPRKLTALPAHAHQLQVQSDFMPTRLLDVATAQASLGAVRRSAWQRVRVARFIQIIVERAAAGGWHPAAEAAAFSTT